MKPDALMSSKAYLYTTVTAYLTVACLLSVVVSLSIALLAPLVVPVISIVSFLLP